MNHSPQHLLRMGVAGALCAAVALPSAALAEGSGDRGSGHGVPARVKLRVKKVERALERAVDHIDEGEDAAAVTSLASVRRHMGRASSAALKRIDSEKGPRSIGAVLRVEDEVAQTTADSLDGEDGTDLVPALTETLDAALDGRDTLVAAIAALEDSSDYDRVLDDAVEDSTDEAEAFAEAVTDDELTAEAEAALTAAAQQAAATATAAQAILDAADADEVADESDDDSDDGPRGDCPEGEGGGRGPGHHGPGSSGSSDDSDSYGT